MAAEAVSAGPWERLAAAPRVTAVAGALAIAWSSILVKLADTTPGTAAVFRCAYAVPLLLILARLEDRRLGPRPRRARLFGAAAGIVFAVNLICWHHAIENVGAGLATVLGNLQVAIVPLAAWMLLRERPSRTALATLPLVLTGIVLISGALEHGAYGDDPHAGVVFGILTGVAYAGFLMLLRAAGTDLRRPAGPLLDATAVGAVAAALISLPLGELRVVPSWPAHGWLLLLAITSQVVGWLLITSSLPRMPSALSSLLLTIQPIGSVLLGVIIFGEAPTGLQLVGVAAILAGVVVVTRSARRPATVTAAAPASPPGRGRRGP